MRLQAVILCAFALVACGGGDSGPDSPGNNPSPSPAPLPPPVTFNVTTNVSGSGTVTPDRASVQSGETVSLTLTPDEGFRITEASGCGGRLDDKSYTTGAISADCVVTVSFTINSYEIRANADAGGSISPSSIIAEHFSTVEFTVVPDVGFSIVSVSGCGGTLDGDIYTTASITDVCTVTATFDLNTYEITATASEGGSIDPPSILVDHGTIAAFTVIPNDGYFVASVTGCDGDFDGDIFRTGVVTESCQLEARFTALSELLNAEYSGVMRSPKNVFFTDSTRLTFGNVGLAVEFEKDAFFGRTCEFVGEVTGNAYPLTGSGTFRCSDFTSGAWANARIAKTDPNAVVFSAEMATEEETYVIEIAGFRQTPPDAFQESFGFWERGAALTDFPGLYDGKLQSLDSCAGHSFTPSSTDLLVEITDEQIFFEQDAFFEGVCRFEGQISDFAVGVVAASGSYECSNFDEGTWSTSRVVMTGADSIFAELEVDVPSRGCSYNVRYLGFRPQTGSLPPDDPPGPPADDDDAASDPAPPSAPATLQRCDAVGCESIGLPYSSITSSSQTVLPVPDWYTIGEYRLILGAEDLTISNVDAQLISGSASEARITGLSYGTLEGGAVVEFALQVRRSPSTSTVQYRFDIEGIPGSPSSFFVEASITTN